MSLRWAYYQGYYTYSSLFRYLFLLKYTFQHFQMITEQQLTLNFTAQKGFYHKKAVELSLPNFVRYYRAT